MSLARPPLVERRKEKTCHSENQKAVLGYHRQPTEACLSVSKKNKVKETKEKKPPSVYDQTTLLLVYRSCTDRAIPSGAVLKTKNKTKKMETNQEEILEPLPISPLIQLSQHTHSINIQPTPASHAIPFQPPHHQPHHARSLPPRPQPHHIL
jgi:hypothetical protein